MIKRLRRRKARVRSKIGGCIGTLYTRGSRWLDMQEQEQEQEQEKKQEQEQEQEQEQVSYTHQSKVQLDCHGLHCAVVLLSVSQDHLKRQFRNENAETFRNMSKRTDNTS